MLTRQFQSTFKDYRRSRVRRAGGEIDTLVSNDQVIEACVGGCGKVGRKNSAMECPDIGTHNGTYDAVILEKGERSRAIRSYADVTREDVKTPLGKNRLIIS